jgi:hypothetical protein
MGADDWEEGSMLKGIDPALSSTLAVQAAWQSA